MKINLRAIEDKLQRGDIALIATKTGLSEMTVSRHLTGKAKKINPAILKMAVKVIRQREKDNEKLNKIIRIIE